jgi:hypothetical protein
LLSGPSENTRKTRYFLIDASPESAASIVGFLYQLTAALERHYAGQLLRHAHRYEPESLPPDPQATDPPF